MILLSMFTCMTDVKRTGIMTMAFSRLVELSPNGMASMLCLSELATNLVLLFGKKVGCCDLPLWQITWSGAESVPIKLLGLRMSTHLSDTSNLTGGTIQQK